jgi:hypothetical protein
MFPLRFFHALASNRVWFFSPISLSGKRMAKFPRNHASNIGKAKKFPRGASSSLHCRELGCNITYWNDSNTVVFIDNDVSADTAHARTVEVNISLRIGIYFFHIILENIRAAKMKMK